MRIDFSKVVPIDKMTGLDETESEKLETYLEEARNEINYYSWHDGIVKEYFGMGVGGIFAVFLFQIKPNKIGVDDYVWVIVGDLPPAYITCEEAPNPACALDGYIGAMSEWVDAAKTGQPVDELIPVNVPATIENGNLLEIRLQFLDQKVLSQYEADLNL